MLITFIGESDVGIGEAVVPTQGPFAGMKGLVVANDKANKILVLNFQEANRQAELKKDARPLSQEDIDRKVKALAKSLEHLDVVSVQWRAEDASFVVLLRWIFLGQDMPTEFDGHPVTFSFTGR